MNLRETKNRICKTCGETFIRIPHSGSIFCSDQCLKLGAAKLDKCNPSCVESDEIYRIVYFKDGTDHVQKCCDKCLKTTFVPKEFLYRVILSGDAEFVTPAARLYPR
jgi:hypothetical protein